MMTRSSKFRIFVVEDHPGTARALKMFLESSGFAVDVALDMTSALALAERIEFDVMLCDLNLPDGNGWDLLTELRKKRKRNVRAIAFSAFDDAHHLERSRAAGFISHLVKGLDPEDLLAALKNACAASPPKTRKADAAHADVRSRRRAMSKGHIKLESSSRES
jgi:DNA-binding response OmpR family regulator